MTAPTETRPDTSQPTPLTHAEAVARARNLAADVRSRAAEAEILRHLPDETFRAFVDASLVRLLTPRAFGGHEMPFAAFLDATLEIARADASAGWCFSFTNIHSWLLAKFPREAQKDVWAHNPDAGLANVNIPAGQALRVEDGYRLTGDWPWASGIHHCDWAILAALVPPAPSTDSGAGTAAGPGAGTVPDVMLFLVPRAHWELRDTWRVVGQRGTGSHNVVVKDAFIPQHRAARLLDLRDGRVPGVNVHATPLYALPMISGLAASLVAPILGAAQGAYDRWCAVARDRVTTFTQERIASLSHQQIRLAEVSAEIDAADLLLRRAVTLLDSGVPLTLHQRARLRRDYAYCATLCLRAVERMFNASGGASNYETSPLQRDWRDIHAMAAHAGINFDAAGENFGRFELGLPPNPRDPLI
ncbi:acyl-CoA dehydrogenase family protein [Chondromyces apiculatus]|uniref:Putative pigment protein n=1 Tax=Chondromyces apiculatus DSM 436 TaxID=1192034 RepID=A0A017SZX4_9BACT|nr:acyl-CoA dehydrogenase family protein [Chondromyces apiculatus]EYF01866.1 putative pigment protein [Chondromyces apiculatus DSM 436]